jgi:hypothetical protein
MILVPAQFKDGLLAVVLLDDFPEQGPTRLEGVLDVGGAGALTWLFSRHYKARLRPEIVESRVKGCAWLAACSGGGRVRYAMASARA